ncbi:MAG TPA: hypothetical protein VGZ93_02545 [Candidatus Methylacidiphilales bacterium]|nr:hypothetical protein [Candidatus Methylacidiphilales bacterium]
MSRLTILVALLLSSLSAKAGCAVAIEVKPNGSTFTHSESSLTPKGGHNYISAADAATVLMDDLKRQSVPNAQLIFQSDLTGYFSVAIGHTSDGTLVNNVARAQDPRQADKLALAALKQRGVSDGMIANRFHSYGDPSKDSSGNAPN